MTTSPQPSGAEPLSADELSEYSKVVKMDLPPGQDQAFYRWGNEAVDRLLATIAQRDQKIAELEVAGDAMLDNSIAAAVVSGKGYAVKMTVKEWKGHVAACEAWRKLREGR